MKLSEIELINYDDGIKRFAGSEALYNSFLLKYVNDQSFSAAKTAFNDENKEELAHAVHTLKGVSGNLSLINLYNVCCDILEMLRNGIPIDEAFNTLSIEQEKVVDAISNATK